MSKSKSISKSSSCLKEPPSVKLQKDLESITMNLEYEKRESAYLDEQIQLFQYEISSMPKSKKNSNSVLKASVSVIEKKLELERNQLNLTRFKNKQLRSQIDEYRLDKSAHKQSLNSIQETLDKTSKATEEQYNKIAQEKEIETEHIEKIGFLRSKSASQRSKYDEKISTLASFLKNGGNKQRLLYEEKNYSLQSIEVVAVLKQILKNCEKNTAEKKKNIDMYLKHINYLISGFNQIKIATGMNYVDDIVTACIKSEQQGQEILYYFNNLNNEIDVLEETLKFNKSKIEALEGSKKKGNLNIQEFRQKNEKNFAMFLEKIEEKREKMNFINRTFEKILPVILKTYKFIEKMSFQNYFTETLDVSTVEKLNQENCDFLLGQIEEFINYLLMALASKDHRSLINRSQVHKEKPEKNKHEIQEFLDENDIYDEPGIEDIKVPISIVEMKHKAVGILEQRRNIIKRKSHTPETYRPKTPTNNPHRND